MFFLSFSCLKHVINIYRSHFFVTVKTIEMKLLIIDDGNKWVKETNKHLSNIKLQHAWSTGFMTYINSNTSVYALPKRKVINLIHHKDQMTKKLSLTSFSSYCWHINSPSVLKVHYPDRLICISLLLCRVQSIFLCRFLWSLPWLTLDSLDG